MSLSLGGERNLTDPLEEIYQVYKESIFHYLYNMCRNRSIAEELTHDTFIKVFNGYGRFRGESSLKTWLFKIARNTYINEAMKLSRLNEIPYLDSDSPKTGTNIDVVLIVRQTFQRLSEKEKSLLTLREQGFSLTEMAEILNQTEGSIKVGIYRAKKKFKQYYLEGGEEGR